MPKLAILTVLILVALGNIGTSAAEAGECPKLVKQVVKYRAETWANQELLQQRKTPTRYHERTAKSCRYVSWLVDTWKERATQTKQEARKYFRTLYAKWRCIHLHEGAWNANTGNGYYGGLQMDYGFQRTYGSEFMARWGTANNWPVWAQLVAAERAFHGYHGYGGRGYGPWPNTSRACGLY